MPATLLLICIPYAEAPSSQLPAPKGALSTTIIQPGSRKLVAGSLARYVFNTTFMHSSCLSLKML
jgi:hypothetical protein